MPWNYQYTLIFLKLFYLLLFFRYGRRDPYAVCFLSLMDF